LGWTLPDTGQRGQAGQGRPVGVDADWNDADAAQRDWPGADKRGEGAASPDGIEGRVAEHGRVESRVHAAGNQVPDGSGEDGRAGDERGGAQSPGELLVVVSGRGDHPEARLPGPDRVVW
jgi:hypothetical protein